jgi:ribonuclease P protein component
VAFAIGRKIGGAVVRNRLRRRLRAISGELSQELASGAYLFIVSREAVSLSYGELKADVKAALVKINERRS